MSENGLPPSWTEDDDRALRNDVAAESAADLAQSIAQQAQTPLPEAPVSVTVKVLYQGYDTMLTLRDVDGKRALTRLGVALDWLAEHGACANGAPGRQNGNVQRANGATNNTATGATPLCPTHGVAMRASQFGGWYCPQKIADDDGAGSPVYCKAKSKQ